MEAREEFLASGGSSLRDAEFQGTTYARFLEIRRRHSHSVGGAPPAGTVTGAQAGNGGTQAEGAAEKDPAPRWTLFTNVEAVFLPEMEWYDAIILAEQENGTYSVRFEDGVEQVSGG